MLTAAWDNYLFCNLDFKYSTRMIISTSVAGLVVYCVSNTFFLGIENYCSFLHETMEKTFLNLRFKFHDFFPWNNKDAKVLSFEVFSFQT